MPGKLCVLMPKDPKKKVKVISQSKWDKMGAKGRHRLMAGGKYRAVICNLEMVEAVEFLNRSGIPIKSRPTGYSRSNYNLRVAQPSRCRPGRYGTDDIGRKGGHLRIACQPKGGRKDEWITQAYRLPIREWERKGNTLFPITENARKVHQRITQGGKLKIVRKKGDFDFELKKK